MGGSAIFQMKAEEKTAEFCTAMLGNTAVTCLKMKNCNINDTCATLLGEMLANNTSITEADLSSNAFKEDGGIAIANGLAQNVALRQLDLMSIPALGRSERVLRAFINMYDSNLTLKKVIWRLEHPLANTLAKLMTRNNSIDRRIQQSKGFDDLLPDHLKGTGVSVLGFSSLSDVETPRSSVTTKDRPTPTPEQNVEGEKTVEQPPAESPVEQGVSN